MIRNQQVQPGRAGRSVRRGALLAASRPAGGYPRNRAAMEHILKPVRFSAVKTVSGFGVRVKPGSSLPGSGEGFAR
jgi:hypothetical protein